MTTNVEVELQSRVRISVQTDVYISPDDIKDIEKQIVEHAKEFRTDK